MSCRVDNDCFLSHICLNNMCVIGCRANSDCSGGEACVGQRCANPCEAQTCGPNSVCTVVNHQPKCSCPAGMIPNPTPFVGCVREPSVCQHTRDCGEGFLCESGSCRPICSTNANCLSNEICDKGVCKPICRKDSDCRSGEICEGLTCIAGCRSDTECPVTHACSNNKCVDPCTSPLACGVNTQCAVKNHQVNCKCLEGLTGDSRVACRAPEVACSVNEDCTNGNSCIDNICRPLCTSDAGCLADERCIGGLCKPLCSVDDQCRPGYICQGQICLQGCRSDNQCPTDKACINRQCRDACKNIVCGTCSSCQVVNHSPQCSCPSGTIGNALESCITPPARCAGSFCSGGGRCEGGYCVKACNNTDTCGCGQTCRAGECRNQCFKDDMCPQNQLCEQGLCISGCRQNTDCNQDSACLNGICTDPCGEAPCGKNALCRVSQHRPICLCPNGYQGEPSKECKQIECNRDDDCDSLQMCIQGSCKNPCLQPGACGTNAQCRVINRRAQCTCPLGHVGDPRQKCAIDENECLSNPCGENAKCIDTISGYRCTCESGCSGDPSKGCVCKPHNACADIRCGLNAVCQVDVRTGKGSCRCPDNFPDGNPNTECMWQYSIFNSMCNANGHNNYNMFFLNKQVSLKRDKMIVVSTVAVKERSVSIKEVFTLVSVHQEREEIQISLVAQV